jgi:hypothetical protein
LEKVENGLFNSQLIMKQLELVHTLILNNGIYPTIAAALDVMMEESTTLNDKGRMMNIYSDSKRVKGILEDLFSIG